MQFTKRGSILFVHQRVLIAQSLIFQPLLFLTHWIPVSNDDSSQLPRVSIFDKIKIKGVQMREKGIIIISKWTTDNRFTEMEQFFSVLAFLKEKKQGRERHICVTPGNVPSVLRGIQEQQLQLDGQQPHSRLE